MPNASELRRVKLPTAEEAAANASGEPQVEQLALAPVATSAGGEPAEED